MPEGNIEEVKIDQNGDEVEEDEDGEITKQSRNLKTLNQYQQNIVKLQIEKEQLLKQAIARNRGEQTQRAIREAKIQRDRLVREIQGPQGAGAGGAIRAGGNIVISGDNLLDEDEGAYDPASHLSRELQLYFGF